MVREQFTVSFEPWPSILAEFVCVLYADHVRFDVTLI